MHRIRRRLTYANVMSSIAVFIVLGGAAFAAVKLPKNSVGTKQIKKNAVIGSKVKDGSLTGADINASTLGTVPSATNAGHASSADTATNASKLAGKDPSAFASAEVEPFHEVGAAGQPAFENGWNNESPSGETTAAFYKDPFGIVHLKGIVTGGASSTVIFTLPEGYRLTKSGCFATIRERYVCIYNDGAVRQAFGTAGSVALDGMTFRAGTG